ncbi:MAG: phosphoglycolate phosphatase [Methylococcus sp.]|nr:MAG: phosphoglycolate phosphatase [Methylococcus sp.]
MTDDILPRCILFDLDGTLLDTAPDLHAALNQALGREGFESVPLENARPWISHGAPGMVRNALGGAEEHPAYDRVLDRMIEDYGRNLAVRTSLFKGMEQTLEKIEHRGLSWGIVTNKQSRFTEPLLKALNLLERASCVISGDTTKHKKPHPEPLLEACRQTAIKPRECFYVGDAEKDIRAGRHAGMRTLAAAYGYRSKSDNVADWLADGILTKPLDLLQWIPQLD